jgi:Terminase large subunit, T4likevirus-type, N-terminal/Terminase RNaseH-like domain
MKLPKTLLEKEIRKRQALKEHVFTPQLFDLQWKFIRDPAKLKTLLCGRQAGKSTTAASYLCLEAHNSPDIRALYIGLTRKSAKNVIWADLKKLNRDHKLGMKFNHTELTIQFPNGSEIFLFGANDEAAAETIRGMRFKLVLIDEVASFRSHLTYLIDEVIVPTLIKEKGTLGLIGTPSAACAGPFFDSAQPGSPYSKHGWTILQNPYIPHAAEWLEDYRIKKGWSKDNAVYLREWQGHWIKSDDSLCYHFDISRNGIDRLPTGKDPFSYTLGVDIGYNDATAWVVGAWREYDSTFYITETFAKTKMTVDEIMEKTKQFIDKYKPYSVVMDSGGGGKLVAESFTKRYQIAIKPAQKKDKKDFIEQMNADLYHQRIKVVKENKELIEQWDSVQWDENYEREDERFVCDLADAALYTWRESIHYVMKPKEVKPAKGSKEYYKSITDEMEEAAMEFFTREEEEQEKVRKFWGEE